MAWINVIKDYQRATFDIEITPSRFIALFLAVNRSSLHPETSSCKQTRSADSHSKLINKSHTKNSILLTRSDGRFFRRNSSASSSHSEISYHKVLPYKRGNQSLKLKIKTNTEQQMTVSSSKNFTFSFITNAGKIAESNNDEKWGETNLHPYFQMKMSALRKNRLYFRAMQWSHILNILKRT